MTVVSNTTPLCYLTLIGHSEILPKLYGNIHITQKVLEELRHPDAPPSVRDLAAAPPNWLIIHSDPEELDQTLAALDPGERTALRLCDQLRSDVVLLDEAAARAIADQRGLKISGTLGVLCDASRAGFLKLPNALDLLRKTNFRASPELWKSLYSR
jgi:predicted nucleic acid-binding protein